MDFLSARKYLSIQLEGMLIRSLNTILSLLFVVSIQSQTFDKKDFKNYRIKDGLSFNKINAITQDAYGYIWIGTDKGLNRFDGSRFDHFYADSLAGSLLEDRVFNLKRINNEELAVLTAQGLNIINTKTLQMRNMEVPPDSLKRSVNINRVLDVNGDKKGNIFIGSSGGFYHFKNDKIIFRYDHSKKGASFCWEIINVNDNTLLLSTSDGLFIYNIDKKDMHRPNNNDHPFLQTIATPEQRFRFRYSDERYFIVGYFETYDLAFFDINNKIRYKIHQPVGLTKKLNLEGQFYRLNDTLFAAVSSSKGFHLIHFNKQTGSWFADTTLYFENYFCTSLMVDNDLRLWISTTDGLYKQNKIGARVEQTKLEGEGGGILRAITGLAISNDKILAATAMDGLHIFNKDQLSFSQHILLPHGLKFIPGIVRSNDDSILLAGSGYQIDTRSLELTKIDPENTLGTGYIKSMFKDSHNRIFVGKSRSDTLYVKNPGERIFSSIKLPELQSIRAPSRIAEDNDGNIWLGGFGLLRFNDRLNKIDLQIDSFPYIKKMSPEITSNIVFDKSEKMYFGIYGSGLMIYHITEKKISHLTRSDGLPDNTITALYLHNNKTLWVATENGLASYDINTQKISAYGVADGIPIDPNELTAILYDPSDSLLYTACSPVILRFNPYNLKKNTTPPKLFIESVKIIGGESIYHPANAITVPFKNNSLTINLTAINYEDAPFQLFAYRLVKKGNEDWQQIGTQNHIFFDNLPVGKHKLQVKVYIRNQSWPDQVKEIIITVKPPFWKTIWFYLIMGLLIATLLFFLLKRRLKQLTQKANVDMQLAQSEMKALHAQMNPHFIFNCLNSIREMILNNENEQASLYLSKFARLIRITLNQSSKPFVNLSDTIDYLERYVEMEKIRSDHFTYTIELGDDLQPNEIMLPAMLIQPFIENAIWHGTLSKKNLDVHVSFRKKGNELVCIVEDNGIGIEESLQKKENISTHPSVGIANIRQRIELLNEKYNLQSSVIIQDKKAVAPTNGTGTVVTLHLPIKTNESLWTT